VGAPAHTPVAATAPKPGTNPPPSFPTTTTTAQGVQTDAPHRDPDSEALASCQHERRSYAIARHTLCSAWLVTVNARLGGLVSARAHALARAHAPRVQLVDAGLDQLARTPWTGAKPRSASARRARKKASPPPYTPTSSANTAGTWTARLQGGRARVRQEPRVILHQDGRAFRCERVQGRARPHRGGAPVRH
jgi:hypothetical protein